MHGCKGESITYIIAAKFMCVNTLSLRGVMIHPSRIDSHKESWKVET